MESTFKERLKYFTTTLKQDENDNEQWSPIIDMNTFRKACFHGIPEDSAIHATAWKVLLGYLPPDKNMWQKTIYEQRLTYYNLVRDLLAKPTEEPPSNDHPLNVTPGSKWATYIHDNTILEQIDKDVKRTLPDFAFFQQKVPQNPLNPLSAPLPPSSTNSILDNHTDPLDEDDDILDPLQANDVKRRFSFGIIGRPRSGSNASRKSSTNNHNIVNRSRSNSKSSARSFSTGMIENGAEIIQSPRNLVRKISTAFSKSNSSLSLNTYSSTTNTKQSKKYNHHHQQQPVLKPICPYIPNRRSLFKRIQQQMDHYENNNSNSSILMNGQKQKEIDEEEDVQDYHWEVIERILFMYAKLNPGIGYVQGMNEILAPIYYVFANDTSMQLSGQVHAEADTFFSFSILMGEVRDHFVRSLDQDATTGIHATMLKMQQRLAWYDRSLLRELQRKDIKEAYYAFRWITVLFTQEWDLPNVIRLWDSLLAERGMQDVSTNANHHHHTNHNINHPVQNGYPSPIMANETPFEFLLDFSVAMLVCIRQELFKGDFAENVNLLQNYPISDIQYVLNAAYQIRESRLQAMAIGQGPGMNIRHSGLLNSDWSDTSSISSTTSTASSRLQQKLRESTELARASFDSFKRESKESMDDMFRRGMVASSEQWKRASTGDMKRSISQRLGFVKTNMMAKAKRSSSIRSTTSESNSLAASPTSPTQQRHWLLANQYNNNNNSNNNSNNNNMNHHLSSPSSDMQRSQSDRHQRIASSSSQFSIDSNLSSKSANVFNRFSQMVISNNHPQSSSTISSTSATSTPFHFYDTPSNPLMSSPSSSPHQQQQQQLSSHEEDNEKLIFAKAEEARYQALHYRTSTAYKGCV
ncbi:unnamed protein product [Cunninghamella blakesleeana]